MSSLRAWIRQKLHPKRDIIPNLDDIPQGFPILPSPRRSPLSFDVSGLPSSSPFFQKLTLELRRAIYQAAFGDKTFHVDLEYQHPHLLGPYHANLVGGRNQYDVAAPEAWRWWSCVCHRFPFPSIQAQVLFDECRVGSGTCNVHIDGHPDPDRDSGACFLGVMGWLLSCRQGYLEVVDVIYSTNTFFIQSVLLTQYISRVLVPQNLAFVTSFEFKWDILPGQNLEISTKTYNSRGWDIYTKLMSLINTSSFPMLQKLMIIVDDLGLESKTLPHPLLEPSDQIVRDFDGKLERFHLQLPPSFFKLFQGKLEDINVERGGEGVFSYEKFWRAAPESVQPEQGLKVAKNEVGYWLFKGVDHHIPNMG